MAGFDAGIVTGWLVLILVLSSFTILALMSAGYIPVPSALQKFILASSSAGDETVTVRGESGADFFLSARNSAGATAIALSYFASGMGAWVFYGSTEMGATPQLSWLGVIGYSAASGFPAIIFCLIGPKVRKFSGEKVFSSTDFGRKRYGRLMQLVIGCISLFYMWIYLVSELTSISNVYVLVVGDSAHDNFNVWVCITAVLFTLFYTSTCGLPASIATDKFQALMMGLLIVVLTIAVSASPENKVTKKNYNAASNWTIDGFQALVTLFIAIACAEMFNQGSWQRVWAAKSDTDMRKGFALGSVMVFFLMFFFGLMGVLAYAKDPDSYDNFEKLAYLSFFDLLVPLGRGWHVLVLIFVTALAASSIDTLQNALTCVFSSGLISLESYLKKNGHNSWVDCGPCGRCDYARMLARLFLVLVNIPAVILASKGISVLTLFLVADLVCATATLPVFLGLITKDIGPIPAPTELGAFLGVWSGIGTVLCYGSYIGFEQATTWDGKIIATGTWSYFWLTNGDICALCGPDTMYTFISTVLISGFTTLFFSKIHILIMGDAARKPVFHFLGDDNAAEAEAEAEQKVVEAAEEKVVEAA